MLIQGFRFMVIGMSTVFVFLGIMILVMNVTAVILRKLAKRFPEPAEVKESQSKLSRKIRRNEEIAVAIAAVKAFRNG